MVTIKDVAKRAGVSIAAVSYALNDKEGVNEETKKRVREIADEMGYIPNSLAQGLLSKKTNIIGLVLPDISNLYNASFINHLNFYARQNNYFLLLGNTANDITNVKEIVSGFLHKNVDALIIVPHNYCEDNTYESIVFDAKRRHIPVLFTNMNFPGLKTSYVVPDLEEGQYQITRYLLENGLKDLIFVGGGKNHYYSEVKYKGFLRAFDEFNISARKDNCYEVAMNYSFKDGYDFASKFPLENKLPEAFIAVNDMVAYGMIRGLKQHGIRVPEDVSFVGFDDIELPIVDSVGLTTMRIPMEEMAKLSMDIIVEGTEAKLMKQYILQPELVIRQSVKLPR